MSRGGVGRVWILETWREKISFGFCVIWYAHVIPMVSPRRCSLVAPERLQKHNQDVAYAGRHSLYVVDAILARHGVEWCASHHLEPEKKERELVLARFLLSSLFYLSQTLLPTSLSPLPMQPNSIWLQVLYMYMSLYVVAEPIFWTDVRQYTNMFALPLFDLKTHVNHDTLLWNFLKCKLQFPYYIVAH